MYELFLLIVSWDQSNYMLHICVRHIFLVLCAISLSITFQNISFLLLFLLHILLVFYFPYLLLSTARCFFKLIHISSSSNTSISFFIFFLFLLSLAFLLLSLPNLLLKRDLHSLTFLFV